MKTNKQLVCLAALLLMLSNCKKDKPQIKPAQGELQTVSFHLSGFTAEITPLGSAKATARPPKLKAAATGHHLNISPGPDPQFVYFWSFNQSNLLPDIAADDGAEISFVASNTEPDFVTGYGFSPYAEAGKAFSTKATASIRISLPLQNVESLSQLAFDAGSSGTGPKDFKISYSVDNGTSYEVLAASNPLDRDSRSEYEYALDAITAIQDATMLDIKIEPVPGTNPTTGTFRLDNIRFTGVYTAEDGGTGDPENPATVSKIHYYLFDAVADTLETSGSTAFDPNDPQAALSLQLEPGTYSAVFISNVSAKELVLPPSVQHAADLFAGNAFDNDQAEIFGAKLEGITVSDQAVEKEAVLGRLYSQVTFNFTDATGLSSVKQITVSRVHDDFWYTPNGVPASLPASGVSSVSFQDPFTTVNGFSFNQFMGELAAAAPISYTVKAFDAEDNLLRTFTVSSAIKNNVQLSFTGLLLDEGSNPNGNFAVSMNLDWDTPVDETF